MCWWRLLMLALLLGNVVDLQRNDSQHQSMEVVVGVVVGIVVEPPKVVTAAAVVVRITIITYSSSFIYLERNDFVMLPTIIPNASKPNNVVFLVSSTPYDLT
jgi:hypothetical protein